MTAPRSTASGRWAYAGSTIAISMSSPTLDGPGGRIGQVGGEAVGDQAADRVGVADHEPLEAEGPAQHVGEQPPVPGRGDAVERHVRRHHVARAGLDRGLERRQVDVPQLGVREVHLVVVAAAERPAVPREVLGPGDHALGRPEPLALEAAHLGGADGRAEERVLACALDDAAPARVARDVDHRREGPVDADRPGLPGGDGLPALDDVRVPRRRHRDRHREDRAQAVDHVEAEQRRDAVPVALDRQPLEPVGLGRVGDEQQRPDLAAREGGLDQRGLLRRRQLAASLGVRVREAAEVEVLRQLAGLLLPASCRRGSPRPARGSLRRSSTWTLPGPGPW